MAIKPKNTKEEASLPQDLDNLCQKGFTFQQLAAAYEDAFKAVKGDVEEYLKTSDEVDVTEGEGVKTPYGSIIYMGRSFYKYDNDAIINLVKKGKVSIEQILSCVSGFKAEELEKTLSSGVFETVATKSETKSLTFRASNEFKDQVRSTVDTGFAEEPAPKKPAPKAAPKESPAEKARAAKAKLAGKAAKKSKGADEDLDEILRGK